jgi:hypothetical protein
VAGWGGKNDDAFEDGVQPVGLLKDEATFSREASSIPEERRSELANPAMANRGFLSMGDEHGQFAMAASRSDFLQAALQKHVMGDVPAQESPYAGASVSADSVGRDPKVAQEPLGVHARIFGAPALARKQVVPW